MYISKKIELYEFLKTQPFMSTKPSQSGELIIEGDFSFSALSDTYPQVEKTYKIQIKIFNNFPFNIPQVTEIGKTIPRDGNHHINPDKTLCLGSKIKLLELIQKKPTINGFVEYCLVPFLYAVTLKIEHDIDYVFGELSHGDEGVINDYSNIFGVDRKEKVNDVLKMLSLNKRVANKKPCPCKCGNRLGKCSFRLKINDYRKLAPRSWFKANFLK